MIQLIVFDAVGTLLYPAEPIATTYRRIFSEFEIQADEQVLKTQFRTSFAKRFEPIKLLDDDRVVDFVRGASMHPSVNFGHQQMSHRQLELVELVKQVTSPTSETHQKECWQGVVFDCIDRFSSTTSEANRIALFESLWQHFARPQAWNVESQVADWVRTCTQSRIPWAVASNFDSRLVRVLAGHREFDTCEKIYDSASLGYQKPDLSFYHTITNDFQLPADRILMIGDNAIGDYLAPKVYGWQAYWLEHQGSLSLGSLLQQLDR